MTETAVRARQFIDAPEHSTLAGALALAKRIEAYWAERGGVVRTKTESLQPYGQNTKMWFVFLRSDMVNGAPRKAISHG